MLYKGIHRVGQGLDQGKSPILGLLLLLNVFPLLSDFSEPNENFIKIKFFNLNSNFDKTSIKKLKSYLV